MKSKAFTFEVPMRNFKQPNNCHRIPSLWELQPETYGLNLSEAINSFEFPHWLPEHTSDVKSGLNFLQSTYNGSSGFEFMHIEVRRIWNFFFVHVVNSSFKSCLEV